MSEAVAAPRTAPPRVLTRAPAPATGSARVRTVGVTALAICVCASSWLALGAAGGGYLLDLPAGAGNADWIDGPLKGLAGVFGAIGPNGLDAGLLALAGGYLAALLCAGALSLRAAMLAVVLANLAFTLGPTIVSSDVFGYIAYARELSVHGLDPYVSGPIALGRGALLQLIYWKHQPSPYGPLFTFLSAPLGPLSSGAALWLLKLAAGAASVATTWIVSLLAGRRGLHPPRAAIFVGLNPVLLFYAVSGGHNDLLAILLVVGAFALTLGGLEAAGAGAAVAAAAVKLTAGLALPFVLIAAVRRGRASTGAGLAIAVIGLPTVLLFGLHFVDQLHRISTDPLFDTAYSGPDRLAVLLGTHITSGLRALCTAAAALVALLALAWALRGGDPVTATGWAFLALLGSIASLAPWYLVWLLPLAALANSRPLRVAALLATAYLIAVHLPLLGGVPWLSQASTSSSGSEIGSVAQPAAGAGSASNVAFRSSTDW